MFHKIVKIWNYATIFIIAVMFTSVLNYLGTNPLEMCKFFGAEVGNAVGLSVGVAENPFNKLALQLEEKEDLLNAKENNLTNLENELRKSSRTSNIILLIIVFVLFILFFLILFNYYLDYKRRQEEERKK